MIWQVSYNSNLLVERYAIPQKSNTKDTHKEHESVVPRPVSSWCLTSTRGVTCLVSTNLFSGRQSAINMGCFWVAL